MNLLDELKEELEGNNKTIEDIRWIGSADGEMVVPLKSLDVEYDDGFGAARIASDLVVVGSDWWIERREYDGSEWFEFRSIPKLQHKPILVTKVKGGMWNELDDINNQKRRNHETL